MSPKKALPYALVDTCCIIDFLLDNSDSDKSQRVQDLLEDHGKSVEIVVPTLVRLEVFDTLRRNLGNSTPESWVPAVKKAEEFFEDYPFVPIELDDRVCEIAEGLISEHALRDKDAAIVASALAYEVRKMYTFDKKLIRTSDSWPGLEVAEPDSPRRFPLDI